MANSLRASLAASMVALAMPAGAVDLAVRGTQEGTPHVSIDCNWSAIRYAGSIAA